MVLGSFGVDISESALLDGIADVYAMVVIGVSEQEIVVLDPLHGERRLPAHVFTAAWARRHNLAMLVER